MYSPIKRVRVHTASSHICFPCSVGKQTRLFLTADPVEAGAAQRGSARLRSGHQASLRGSLQPTLHDSQAPGGELTPLTTPPHGFICP